MSRANKGRAVTRYLIGSSGIPFISWDTSIKDISAPNPYFFTVTTDAVNWRYWQKIKELPDKQISAVIRYDKYIDNTADAIAGIRLSTLGKLLAVHYQTIADRVDRKDQD